VPPRASPLIAYYRGFVRERLGRDGTADFDRAARCSTTYVFPNRPSSYAVLRAALRARPDDATARFLLGSLYLASGLTEPAAAAWQRVRQLQPSIPTLHRNLGLLLLDGTPKYGEARAVLEEGITNDPENVDVYAALDGVLSAVGASAADRAAAIRRFRAPERMPPLLVYKLALGVAEAGDAAGAEQLFHDRFFPREEGGTNVRAVYAQTRLISSRLAADRGDCKTALSVLDDLPRERQDLSFTRGTLTDALQSPPMVRQMARIEATCGRDAAARERWSRLERPLAAGGSPTDLAIADEARDHLGHQRSQDQRQRLEDALQSVTLTLDAGNTSNPGGLEYARGLLLGRLDRKEDAAAAFRRVFLSPDRNLSHALAREALR
jgi:tetratricopeptide (TPR) repeat protein